MRNSAWPAGAIDQFILHRIEQEGLQPSSAAPPLVWLRRVTLDLTGFPPSMEEQQEFEQAVRQQGLAAAKRSAADRLLTSPRYAERMAMHWLDVARYADTNGYNNDETRTMWPWRDWVINAFATGMPYDQFVREQLAGDLLPNRHSARRLPRDSTAIMC